MIVSEIFGPTIQGEGPSAGNRCGFVRFGRCNLTCTWCDTPYTWDWKGVNGVVFDPEVELSELDEASVINEVIAMDVPMVVLTGGEPMLQRRALTNLASSFALHGMRVEVETNGTQAPWAELDGVVDQFNVSLKLANSGVAESDRLNDSVIAAFTESENAIFKFVATSQDCLEEIGEIVDKFSIASARVWIMPEATKSDSLQARMTVLADAVINCGWNLTSRMHVAIWNDRREV